MDFAESASRQRHTGINCVESSAPLLFQRGSDALRLLYDAYNYALELNRSRWDFAEEIVSLRERGLTNGDLRWLVCSKFVEHGRERTKTGAESREFQHSAGLSFSKKTCFVLTDMGASYIGQLFVLGESSESAPLVVPKWDRELQELRLGESIVKRFKVPAPNQEMILAVFEEENWPVYIDDPLTPHPAIDPRRRLHDTINSLNRNQKANLIQFRGNGSGDGVRWELINYVD